jgi:hypothetical protein
MGRLALLALTGAVAALLCVPSLASADLSFCPFGSGAGECSSPGGLAIDFQTSRLYVADAPNNRVDVLDASGTFLFAFGWGVRNGAATAQTCGPAASPPSAACQAGIPGSGTGQFNNPARIAVDNEAGSASRHDIYVIDSRQDRESRFKGTVNGSLVPEVNNPRVQKFDSSGNLLLAFGWGVNTGGNAPEACIASSGCQAGVPGDGECQINSFGSSGDKVAIGPSGDVFVLDLAAENVYEKFKGSGVYYKEVLRLEKFSPEGECLGETIWGKADTTPSNPAGSISANGFAIDSEGHAYVSISHNPLELLEEAELRKYSLDDLETPLCSKVEIGSHAPPPVLSEELAFGPNGDLYARESQHVAFEEFNEVTQYDSACKPVHRFGYNEAFSGTLGIATLHSAVGDVFLGEPQGDQGAISAIRYLSEPPPGPITVRRAVEATSVSGVKATFKALVNPEGKPTSYHFEYVSQQGYEEQGNSFEGPNTRSTPIEEVGSNGDFSLDEVSAVAGCPEPSTESSEGKCLVPEAKYRFRFVADNEDGEGEGIAEGPAFETEPPTRLDATWASEVGVDSANLYAELDPLGLPTSGYFEYVDEATYEESGFANATKVPAVPGENPVDFGSAEGDVVRGAVLSDLQPTTTYRYRVVTTNLLVPEPRYGPGRTLRTFAFAHAVTGACPENETFRIGASALLPDCRAYEMVSPVDKKGADVLPGKEASSAAQAALDQSSLEGDKFAFGALSAFADAQSAPYVSQYIAARHERGEAGEGWQTHSISPPKERLVRPVTWSIDTEFKAFSPDLCEAWLQTFTEPVLAEGAVAEFSNLYRRTDSECGGPSYEAITVARPPTNTPEHYVGLELQGVSVDGEAAIYVADDNLTGSEGPQPETCSKDGICLQRLYVQRRGGGLSFVCLLPSGEAAGQACSGGTTAPNIGLNRNVDAKNAISADGKRIYWTAAGSSSSNGRDLGHLFLRVNPEQQQSALSRFTAVGKLSAESNAVSSLVTAKGKGTFSKESTKVTVTETTVGQWTPGQTIAGVGIPNGTTIVAVEGNLLTISKATSASQSSASISSSGPLPFEKGQEITGPGIPPETTITGTSSGSLTLSNSATASAAGMPLSVATGCTEAAKACTIAVSKEAEALSKTGRSQFWAASEDGSKAIFTTTNNNVSESDLYEFDAGTQASHRLAGKVAGVAGVSEDASRVYFASSEVIAGAGQNSAGDEAVAGQPNLYLYEAGAGGGYVFIATLAGVDISDPAYLGVVDSGPTEHASRISGDGLQLAFMSNAAPTHYDNVDAKNGETDAEIYLYDATSGRLACASCNPSGARPAGEQRGGVNGQLQGIAAWIPGFTNNSFASRILSEGGGRLFFNAVDSLATVDTNGVGDVYEWEAAETGDCTTESPSYSPVNEGCVSLISSGRSSLAAEFLDASPSGRDVFFSTPESLVGSDPGQADIYDARVGGGFPAPKAPTAQCEGEACQGTPEAPNDPTPASESFEGAGNAHEPPAAKKPAPCSKGKVRRQGKCVAKHAKKAHKRAKRKRRAGR